jgi:hypothetical protein
MVDEVQWQSGRVREREDLSGTKGREVEDRDVWLCWVSRLTLFVSEVELVVLFG